MVYRDFNLILLSYKSLDDIEKIYINQLWAQLIVIFYAYLMNQLKNLFI